MSRWSEGWRGFAESLVERLVSDRTGRHHAPDASGARAGRPEPIPLVCPPGDEDYAGRDVEERELHILMANWM